MEKRHALRKLAFVAKAAERMRSMGATGRESTMREVRLRAADAGSDAVKRLVDAQVAALDPADEDDSLRWIEEVVDWEPDAAG